VVVRSSKRLRLSLDLSYLSPGYMSAIRGHHYANPTNHFYRCLFFGGFTTQFVPPTEDYTLPELCSVGLTNLVDRPSTEQSELSPSEMVASVPSFMVKVARYRPRIVCFVGMGIWRIVEKTIAKTASPSVSGREIKTPGPPKGKSKKPDVANVGLQPYKLVYDVEPSEQIDQNSSVRETLFFVVPSTSGRVVSHQLQDKVELFADLNATVENYKQHKIDSTKMAAIPLPNASINEAL